MTRPVCLQVYISDELSSAIRTSARAKGITMSEWVRILLADAIMETGPSGLGASIDRMARQSVFLMVGIDGLLAGHSDPGLRERVHQAYARKCKELGLVTSTSEGGAA